MRTNSYSKDVLRRNKYKQLEGCKIIIKALIKIGKNTFTKKELFFLYRLLYNYMEYWTHVKITNKCIVTLRPRGVLRKFKLSRIALKQNILNGYITNVSKH